MKKFSVVIALVLLAVAGTGYAVTCAYDNVPGASLLVPYWRVSLNGATGAPIPSGGVDTLVSIVNVSTPGVIAHVTVWNKYSKAVVDFNLPLTGKDVVSFSMRDIMNGALSPNQTQKGLAPFVLDPCGIVNAGLPNVTYRPSVGFGQNQFVRFSHPEASLLSIDVLTSISQYNLTSPDALAGAFRTAVWDSLDSSGDITSFTSPGTPAAGNILDSDNPACNWDGGSDGTFRTALSGYLTIDVVNYCTNFFPDQAEFYTEDAIATLGWGPTWTPNALIGDVFYVDSAAQGGNISGDQAIALEFDARLEFTPATKTFFGKFVAITAQSPACGGLELTPGGCTQFIAAYAPAFQFGGDGREPLGDHYGFRYLADSANGLQSWLTVWRSDAYANPATGAVDQFNLCSWADPNTGSNQGDPGSGLFDTPHTVAILTYDNDENLFGGVGVPPGPSGQQPGTQSPNYIFLESQRINLLTATDWNPAAFKGGWVDLTLRGPGLTGLDISTGLYNMGWVGVQHTAPGAFVSVGHAAANLNGEFQCSPNFQTTGVLVTPQLVGARSSNPR
jgi:hypothetical protein